MGRNIIYCVLFLSVVFISACGNQCSKLKCLNEGSCKYDYCECIQGYYGESCEKLARDIFIDTFNVVNLGEWCKNTPAYQITIEASNLGAAYVIVNNISGQNVSAFGSVTANNSESARISIPEQVVNGYTVYGSFVLENDGITGDFTAHIAGAGCSGVITRKP